MDYGSHLSFISFSLSSALVEQTENKTYVFFHQKRENLLNSFIFLWVFPFSEMLIILANQDLPLTIS